MKKIPVEFSKQEKALEDLVNSLSARYKANTKEEEKEGTRLRNLRDETIGTSFYVEEDLKNTELLLNKIKSIHLPGMSEDIRTSENELDKFIAEQKVAKGQIERNILYSNRFKELKKIKVLIYRNLVALNSRIEEIDDLISKKEIEAINKKLDFNNKYIGKIKKTIGSIKEKLQTLKVGLAGDNITLKYDESVTVSSSLIDLIKLDRISELISMHENEIEKNKDILEAIDIQENELESLEESYAKNIMSVDEEYIKTAFNEKNEVYGQSLLKISDLDELKKQADQSGVASSEANIMREIECALAWESYYSLQALEDREILQQALNSFNDDKNRSKTEISNTENIISELIFNIEISNEHLNYLTALLSFKLNMILGEENLTIEEAKEKLAEEIANTPYAVRNLKK